MVGFKDFLYGLGTAGDTFTKIMLRAQEGGTHRVTLREIAHNRWYGTTTIEVDGDPR